MRPRDPGPAAVRVGDRRRSVVAGFRRGAVATLQLFEAVHGLLTELAGQGCVLLAIEDLHWADGSTRDLLFSCFPGCACSSCWWLRRTAATTLV